MTGPEHYREAERLIEPGEYDESGDEARHARDIALAQVHATLALAAATALLGPWATEGHADDPELRAWVAVAETPRPDTKVAEDFSVQAERDAQWLAEQIAAGTEVDGG